MTYAPRRNSVAQRLLEFLSQPGAPTALSANQVAERFGVARDSVSTLLGPPTKAGLFTKIRDGGRVLYALPGREADATGTEEDLFGAILDTRDVLTISGGEWCTVGGYKALKLAPEETARLRRLLTGGGA